MQEIPLAPVEPVAGETSLNIAGSGFRAIETCLQPAPAHRTQPNEHLFVDCEQFAPVRKRDFSASILYLTGDGLLDPRPSSGKTDVSMEYDVRYYPTIQGFVSLGSMIMQGTGISTSLQYNLKGLPVASGPQISSPSLILHRKNRGGHVPYTTVDPCMVHSPCDEDSSSIPVASGALQEHGHSSATVLCISQRVWQSRVRCNKRFDHHCR